MFNRIKQYSVKAIALISGLGASTLALATDPATTAATQITALQGSFQTVYDAAFTVMLFIVGALVVWKYGKKLGLKV
jgi:hypothetical protein